MKKIVLIFSASLLMLSCQHSSPKAESATKAHQTTTEEDLSNIGRSNYAVIWTWVTTKPELVSHYLPAISNELTQLWKEDIIENAYFDADAESDKLGDFANVAFFLKAPSISDARSILNGLTVVKQGIATYTLHPVGLLWLDRKTHKINEKGMTKSYVTVWKTQNSKPSDRILSLQSKQITALWEAGTIENVYFDIEGTQQVNSTTDFVFFVNANTQAEAKSICERLPFYQENITAYEMYQAGVFWLGKYVAN